MITVETAPQGGLAEDYPTLRRRRMMGLVGGTTVAALAEIEQARSVLARTGILRGDIRRGFGTASGVAKGLPLTVKLRLTSANSGRAVAGRAVYLWHSDRDGAYSLYSPELTGENYLRGVQVSDDAGWVTFTSIFPGVAEGAWPHLHLEVYPSVAQAVSSADRLQAFRLALPADACARAYADPAYAASRRNMAAEADADGWPAVTGDARRGFVATRTLTI
ncbi:MAG: hypothetical protein ABW022_21200 [Actinoplanes sp.]